MSTDKIGSIIYNGVSTISGKDFITKISAQLSDPGLKMRGKCTQIN